MKLTKIEAVWSDEPGNESAMIYPKTLEINLNNISEKYISEDGENIIIMNSGNEYIVKNFDFLN